MNLGPIPSPTPFREELRGGLHDMETALRSEIHGTLRIDPNRERLRSGNAVIDPFDIADIYAKYAPTGGDLRRNNIANEIDFNWKRYETYGKPDFAEQRMYYDQGWRPVMHEMFPGRFAPAGATGQVIVKDMMLMERPMRLTVAARQEDYVQANRAMQVHRQKVRETPDGSMPRVVYADRTTREAIEIPE